MNRLGWLSTIVVLLILVGCSSNPITVITDLNQIAAERKKISTPTFDITKITIIRMVGEDDKTVEVTSVTPTIVGAMKKGPKSARTTFSLNQKSDHLVLFAQDVSKFIAYHQQIPLSELTEGNSFSFPIVQEDGTLVKKKFTIKRIIIQ